MEAYAILLLMLVFGIAQSIAVKYASHKYDHRTGPIYFSVWTLVALAVTFPFYNNLFFEGIQALSQNGLLLGLVIAKGVILWFGHFVKLSMAEGSLSAKIYSMPTALGFIAVLNSFLGEDLSSVQWFVALGLCALGVFFFLRGHLQDLTSAQKSNFLKLVALAVTTAVLDQIILVQINWYIFLLISNIVIVGVSFYFTREMQTWKDAFMKPETFAAGSLFSAAELIKFYLMVSILPMSVVLAAQVSTIPIIMVISALMFGERGWREQLVWGSLSAVFLLLLFVA